ncbi:MAG: hypothetical protein MRY74_14635 [Neomegalonema sp.]|nr:hypothetical protein [Neomegalonema sp.]
MLISPRPLAARRLLALGAGALLLAAPAAHAQEATSAYTKLDLDKCERLDEPAAEEEGPGGASFKCRGDRGVPLYVSEGDLRFNVDVGKPDDGWISIGPFNTLGETVEWRYGPDGDLKAIIVRYHFSSDGVKSPSELAVITPAKDGRKSCYIAFVKPDAAPSQNEAAREIADDADAASCISSRSE